MFTRVESLRNPRLIAVLVALGLVAALITFAVSARAHDASTALLSLSASEAQPGDVITVEGSGFREGTEASFIYASTITIGGVPIAGVVNVDPDTGFLHAGRTTDSGLHIAQHIDIDPEDTTADGAFTADFVVPSGLPPGDHYLEVISCWGGPDDAYPQDGMAPCGLVGLGGGVIDRIARAQITIQDPATVGLETAELSLSVSEAEPGDVITVEGSGFRRGREASFIYASTITIGGVPIAGVVNVDTETGKLHEGRMSGDTHIAQHIDIDPEGTNPNGAFTADFVVPSGLPPGDHYLEVISCWGGPDDAYPQDGMAPCGLVGLGGGVNDRIATAHITIKSP